ncbi:MAG: cupredoxin domain-containing protein [Acidimicrobiia bacterium]
MRYRHLALMAVIAIALAACGGGDETTTTAAPTTTAGGAGVEVIIGATEFEFDPDELTVPADTEITLTLVNNGVVEHDITIDELDFHLLARPGETVSTTLTVPAGIYMVYCAVPGHHEAGMMGTLIATG